MTSSPPSRSQLLHEAVRPGRPFCPRPSRMRRWATLVLFLLLCSIIGTYWYVTDSRRVAEMAQAHLQELIGGRVTIGEATLSIFEGLRLQDVSIAVDDTGAQDSVLFSARSFLLKYDPAALLRGQLESTRIIAINPHVRLTENLDDGTWNYQRLIKGRKGSTTAPSFGGMSGRAPAVLPEIILRNAQVDYSEIRGGQHRSLGSLAVEGRLTPGSQQRLYRFDLQSRGAMEGIGPVVGGTVNLATGQVVARLENFEFGRDVRSMLPAQVRRWWQEHQLAGRVDIPELIYQPGNGAYQFRVEMDLNGVTLAVFPREWMGRAESERWQALGGGLDLMRAAGLGGWVSDLAARMKPAPIRLERVSGTFVFTEGGIEVKKLTGRVEANAFQIDGRMEGYSQDAPFTIRIASLESENIYIPPSPRYVNSLPRQVREVYERLRPQGTGRLAVEVKREVPGERPEVAGHIEILDGQFVFDKFPYPLRRATGKIVVGRHHQSGMDFLSIENVRGRGVEGGPNANSFITVNGLISPFGQESGVTVRVRGTNVYSEPALRSAFPGEVNHALRIFGPPPGVEMSPEQAAMEYPRLHGDFTCDVIRPIGLRQKWTINTDLAIDDASGALKAFPYPLEGVSATVKIRDGFVQLDDVRMKQGESDLLVNGQVRWGKGRPIEPDIRVRAFNVPIDSRLLEALPPDRRSWLEKIGLGGKLDIEGKVFRLASSAEGAVPATQATAATVPSHEMALDHSFDLTLKEGTVWPVDGTFAIAGLEGRLRLTPDELVIHQLSARRGQGLVDGRGRVSWGDGRPHLNLVASATGLMLDNSLYTMLPAPARRGWDQVQPEGSLDFDLTYDGPVGALDAKNGSDPGTAKNGSDTGAATPAATYELLLRPRELSATPRAFPYRLDELSGTVTVTPERITLQDVAGKHGPAAVRLSGGSANAPGAAWDLKLAGQDVPVDAEFRAAVPPALAELIDAMSFRGRIGFDFARLAYRPSAEVPGGPSPTTAESTGGADAEFQTEITFDDAAMDVGVMLDGIQGRMNLTGAVQAGRLRELAGGVEISRMRTAGRDTENFGATLFKPANEPAMRIGDVRAKLAGGELAGEIDLRFPEDRPASYSANLVLREADVKELTQETDQRVEGRLSASLALEGDWTDPDSRRGRGDVLAAGKQMYRVPLVLGLLQITNLSLPFNTPFSEAAVGYSVEGSRVTFEHISLRSALMHMEGTGSLDFETKKVELTFASDSPGWTKLPILNDLFEGAHHELFKIHVRGTVQEPKISARAMNTFSTTVDEVLRGE